MSDTDLQFIEPIDLPADEVPDLDGLELGDQDDLPEAAQPEDEIDDEEVAR